MSPQFDIDKFYAEKIKKKRVNKEIPLHDSIQTKNSRSDTHTTVSFVNTVNQLVDYCINNTEDPKVEDFFIPYHEVKSDLSGIHLLLIKLGGVDFENQILKCFIHQTYIDIHVEKQSLFQEIVEYISINNKGYNFFILINLAPNDGFSQYRGTLFSNSQIKYKCVKSKIKRLKKNRN